MGIRSNEDIVMKLARTLGHFDARVIMGDPTTYTVEEVRDLLEGILDRSEGGTDEKKEKNG